MYGGRGLGQSVPADVTQNLARLRDLVEDFMKKANSLQDSSLIGKAREFRMTLNAIQFIDVAGGNIVGARREITKLLNEIVPFLNNVNKRLTQGAETQRQAEAGGSFTAQFLRSIGVDSGGDMYVPDVPGGSIADTIGSALGVSAKWILPVGAGLVAFFLLKR